MEMKDLRMHGEDLQGFDMFSQNHQEIVVGKEDEEIWFETASQHHQNNCNSVANNNNNNNNNNNENNNKNSKDEEFLGVDVSDPTSLFYAEFPPLPDFPCMSSSSSSSSTPAASKPFMTSATSSSASTASSGTASWAVLKSDADHDPSSVSMDNDSQHQQGGGGGGEGGGMVLDDVDQCMDMMENFGCIDLLESSDICWDPSPLFEDENGHGNEHDDNQQQQHLIQQQQQQQEQTLEDDDDDEENVFRQFMLQNESNCSDNTNDNNCNIINLGQTSSGVGGGGGIIQQESLAAGEDLGMVFFEWLKSNKEMVSAEDLRNIKIKKSTIDSAAKRLGGGKEGMKQLLKLILQWVQNHHIQSKRIMMIDDDVPNTVAAVTTTTGAAAENNNINNNVYSSNNNHDNNIIANSNPNPNTDLNCMSPSTWMTPPPPPYAADMAGMVPVAPPPSGFAPMVGYMGGDPYGNGYPPPIPGSDFHWAGTPHYGMGPYGPYTDPGFGGYGAAYPAGFYFHPGPGEGLVRLDSSATKEARKKRMARQRRFFTHQHRSHAHHNQGINLNQHNQGLDMNNGNCGVGGLHPGHANWMYWPHPQPQQVVPPPQVNQSVAGAGPVVGQMAPPQEKVGANGLPRQVGGVEKKQGWKTEKNLRFLLQKVLKQSDVGNLGRIVLPKKEAETHLPELEARDGIPIAMEDIGTSRVWNMRYRFWPNNKSRMYLLENTGDFVRSNGLQEGDFIVIYSDVKCGKYMIRGVKVRPQQPGSKPETPTSRINDKPRKTQKTQGTSTPAGNDPPSSPCMME